MIHLSPSHEFIQGLTKLARWETWMWNRQCISGWSEVQQEGTLCLPVEWKALVKEATLHPFSPFSLAARLEWEGESLQEDCLFDAEVPKGLASLLVEAKVVKEPAAPEMESLESGASSSPRVATRVVPQPLRKRSFGRPPAAWCHHARVAGHLPVRPKEVQW